MPVRREFYESWKNREGKKAVALFNLIEVVIFIYLKGVERAGCRGHRSDSGAPPDTQPIACSVGPYTGVCRNV